MSKPGEESTDVDKKEKTRKARTAYDVQRAKLEKLMKDPSKPVYIPTTRTEKDPNKAPDFVYNVMGSSAGAGSGEFHIYRQIRRKEQLRQQVLGERSEKVELNEAYHQKLAENERQAEERTAKKRAKRMKKKQNMKKKKETKGEKKKDDESSSEEEEEEEENEDEEKKESEPNSENISKEEDKSEDKEK